MSNHGVALIGGVAALLVICAASQAQTTRRSVRPTPVRVESVRQSAQEVGQYEPLELTVALHASYRNPFDPDQVVVEGRFLTPAGRTVVVPGFYYQGYVRSREFDGREKLTPEGRASFKIRFAWGEAGRYSYTVSARDRAGPRAIGKGSFSIHPSLDPGYVRRSAEAPHYFQFDSGSSYFALGENLCWPNEPGTYAYDLWLNNLAEAGGNYTRLWLDPEWNELGLEKLSRASGDGNGLGRYDQEAGWRIDYILDLARRREVRVMLSVASFNSVAASGEYAGWRESVYNRANGGPCVTPMEFFTNPDAKHVFKHRLRYLVARWGWSPAVLAWELWNEVDLATGYDSARVAAWHAEMADYLRAIDPWEHLRTTSFSDTDGDARLDSLPQMDYVQSHNYGSHDIAGMVAEVTARKLAAYDKPHYVGEFGVDVYGEENARDPTGLHLHNGLWSAMLAGSAGTAMIWWWDSYVEPRNLYHHFAHAAAFAAEVDWVGENYRPQTASVQLAQGRRPTYRRLSIAPTGESWEERSIYHRPHSYQVGNDGAIRGLDSMSMVLHGVENHPGWHNPVTFQVDYPVAGRFEVTISGVSGYGGAALRVMLDGRSALAKEFTDTQPDDTETMHRYDKAYGIQVPAGAHTIVVENTGADWCYVSYRLTNYVTSPNLRVLALSNPTSALLWVQNRESTWWTARNGETPTPVAASVVTLTGFTPGEYELEQWDTHAGAVAQQMSVTCTDGLIAITTPAGLVTDVAYKLKRLG